MKGVDMTATETDADLKKLKDLEAEVAQLVLRKELLQQNQQEHSECVALVSKWMGIEVTNAGKTSCHVKFSPSPDGNNHGEFTIGFHVVGEYWNMQYSSLPYCVISLVQSIKNAKLKSVDDLCSFIRVLWEEVSMFVFRKMQFDEVLAMTKKMKKIEFYPAINSLGAMLIIKVKDLTGESDLSAANITLKYHSSKYLPDHNHTKFEFIGGDKSAHDAIKQQLAVLHKMPLKVALCSAFNCDEKNESELLSEESHTSQSLVGVNKSMSAQSEEEPDDMLSLNSQQGSPQSVKSAGGVSQTEDRELTGTSSFQEENKNPSGSEREKGGRGYSGKRRTINSRGFSGGRAFSRGRATYRGSGSLRGRKRGNNWRY